MRTINPYMAAASREGEPEDREAKRQRWLERGKQAREQTQFFRLYHGDEPSGMLVECFPMEANAWNKNARAFFAWQAELGRGCLPIMEWRKEEAKIENPMWIVKFRENGQDKEMTLYGRSQAEVKREFNAIASVASRIIEMEREEEY